MKVAPDDPFQPPQPHTIKASTYCHQPALILSIQQAYSSKVIFQTVTPLFSIAVHISALAHCNLSISLATVIYIIC